MIWQGRAWHGLPGHGTWHGMTRAGARCVRSARRWRGCHHRRGEGTRGGGGGRRSGGGGAGGGGGGGGEGGSGGDRSLSPEMV